MNKNKRDLLKGLAAGSAWSAPVVSSVVLPAHAATSCGLPRGCYEFFPDEYALWPGGAGPAFPLFYPTSDCSGQNFGGECCFYMIANSPQEAEAAFQQVGDTTNGPVENQPSGIGTCVVYQSEGE